MEEHYTQLSTVSRHVLQSPAWGMQKALTSLNQQSMTARLHGKPNIVEWAG